MSLDVLAKLCGERLTPHKIGDSDNPSEKKRTRNPKLTEKNVSEHDAQKTEGSHPVGISSDDMSEDSRDIGMNLEDKAGSEGNSEGQQADGDLKKQLRMIRNRQSAALSRKRKADRIDNLLERVAELEEENRQLRRRCGDDVADSGPASSGAVVGSHNSGAAAAATHPGVEGPAVVGSGMSTLQRATNSRSATDLLNLAHSMSQQTEGRQLKAGLVHAADLPPPPPLPPRGTSDTILTPSVSEELIDTMSEKPTGQPRTSGSVLDSESPSSRATRIENSVFDGQLV